MKILHILNNEPNAGIQTIIDSQAEQDQINVVKLYEGEVDYDHVMKLIADHDRVVSWANAGLEE